MCSDLPRQHCFFPPSFWRTALFFMSFSCVHCCFRGSLLDVFHLLGLTLRPSAPDCCCHRVSLTRGRLVLAQEAARGTSSSSSHSFFCCDVPCEFWHLAMNFNSRVAGLEVLFLCTIHLLTAMCFSFGGRSSSQVTSGCAQTWLPLGSQVVTLVIRRFCMMLHSTNFPYDLVGNDSAYILSKVTLFCNVLSCALFPRVFPLFIMVFSFAVVCSWCRVGFANGNHFGFQ